MSASDSIQNKSDTANRVNSCVANTLSSNRAGGNVGLALDVSQAVGPRVRSIKRILTDDVTLGQPADLAFPDDVDCFVSRDRVHRSVHRSKPLAGYDTLLHETVVLLDPVLR